MRQCNIAAQQSSGDELKYCSSGGRETERERGGKRNFCFHVGRNEFVRPAARRRKVHDIERLKDGPSGRFCLVFSFSAPLALGRTRKQTIKKKLLQ